MKIVFAFAQVLLAIGGAQAHYFFPHLIVNHTETAAWRYVRDVAVESGFENDTTQIGKAYPQFNLNSSNMTCGRSAFLSANKTATADVFAGEEVGFHIQHDWDNAENGFNKIFHNGPAYAYLARAPNDDIEAFSGIEGKWFKVAAIHAAHDTHPNPDYWITYTAKSINFTIPLKTPPGKYLLRIEHMMPGNEPQLFVNCAHVNIIGPGGGRLEEANYAQFPGTYKYDDPTINLDWHYWNQPGALLNYVGPGPAVWKG